MTDINIDGVVTWLSNWFQDKLISGTNIKTINNQSLLGSGNINVGGSGGGLSFDDVYPVGSIYMSVNDVNPSTLFGGTWERIQDKFLLSKGSTYTTLEGTGGSATVTLTENQMPSHTHTQNAHHHGNNTSGWKWISVNGDDWGYTSARKMSYSSGSYYYPYSSKNTSGIAESSQTGDTTATNQNKGGGQAHENMPPYLIVNIWKRTE